MNAGSTVLLLVAFLLSPGIGAVWAGDWRDGHCSGVDSREFICGPVNAEDMVRIPGTDWVLASRVAGPGDTHGMFYLLNARDHSWRSLAIDAIPAEPNRALYPDCPGRPTSAAFRGHGIALDERGGALRLLAINHGDRESVEIVAVIASDTGEPLLRWEGCVVAPVNAQLNSVTPLPDNGFAATKFFDATNTSWGEDVFAGRDTGNVLEWSPTGGWKSVEGTTMSGPNGILATSDGSAYFVAEWGARRLHRIPRGSTSARPRAIDTGVHVDNLRWDEQGRLLATGQLIKDPKDFVACAAGADPVCLDPFTVLRVDPLTLASETVVIYLHPREFGSGTTTLDLGTEYWIGTWRGDRIARIAKRH